MLFAGVGAMKSVHSGSGFQSVGVIDVSHGTLLSQLTSIRGETFGYETPASSTSRTMNSLLRTDNFLQEIADSAGIGDQLKSGQITPIALRQSIYSSPDGDTLLQVVATTENPQLSAKLAQATIDSFVKYVVAGDVSESKAAETFFADQLTVYQKALDDAHAALNAYATAAPRGPAGAAAPGRADRDPAPDLRGPAGRDAVHHCSAARAKRPAWPPSRRRATSASASASWTRPRCRPPRSPGSSRR